MYEDYFKNKKAIEEKLLKNNFVKDKNLYRYQQDIDKEFFICLTIYSPYKTVIQVKDKEFKDDYPIFFLDRKVNSFVSNLRLKADEILSKIKEECYEDCYIQERQPDELISSVLKRFQNDIIENKNNIISIKRSDNKRSYLAITKSSIDNNYYIDFTGNDLDIDDIYLFKPKTRNLRFNISAILNDSIPDKNLLSFILLSREENS